MFVRNIAMLAKSTSPRHETMLYPAARHAIQEIARKAERAANWNLGTQLVLLVVAAAAGLFVYPIAGLDIAAAVSMASFIAAGVLAFMRLYNRWDDQRRLAEAADIALEGMVWRYVTGARPYEMDGDSEEIEHLYIDRLSNLRDQLSQAVALSLPSFMFSPQMAVTPEMHALRGLSPAERMHAYIERRLDGLVTSFLKQANLHEKLARRWRLTIIVIDVCGVALAGLKVFGPVHIDLLGFAAAVAGAVSSWFESRRHASHSMMMGSVGSRLSAYRELARGLADGTRPTDDQAVAAIVDGVETLMDGYNQEELSRSLK